MTDQNAQILNSLTYHSNSPLAKALPASLHWQLKLGDAANDNLGITVEAIADIEQCLGIICTTQKGSVPLDPNFAVDIETYIDKPSSNSIPLIVSELTTAIIVFEPRVVLMGVTAIINNYSNIIATITWRPTEAINHQLIYTEVAL
ncbi:MAG: baseplate protein [Rhizobiales bacterium]|nr:baseplate protein [Hyphomicrobiales bacterium]